MTYIYDICQKKECSMVYRGEHRHLTECPRCNQSRYHVKTGKPRKMYYLPVGEWLEAAWADPDIVR